MQDNQTSTADRNNNRGGGGPGGGGPGGGGTGGEARRLPEVDAVVIGLGWTGAQAAREMVDAGLKVVALERGPAYRQRDDFATRRLHDGFRYSVGNALAHPLDRYTLTFRNAPDQTALPMRRIGSFNPAEGFGGSSLTWSGHSFRWLPHEFRLRSHHVERYGEAFIPDGMTIQDTGVSWDEIEPHYARFEDVAGVSGEAGNIGGELTGRGNPFEGPRSGDYPLPAFGRNAGGLFFAEKARQAGYRPFPVPVANASGRHTNVYGATLEPCVLCGHCPGFACAYGAKGSSLTAILPTLEGNDNFEARGDCQVTRIGYDRDAKRVTGVTYVDAAGRETFQPAGLVFLCAYTFDNVHLLLLSGIGAPYDPETATGVVGRNYSYQMLGHVDAFFEDEHFNPFVAGGSQGTVIDEFNGDNFDHGPHGFVGGGFIGPFYLSAFPMTYHPTPEDAPAWGDGWKEAVAKWYPRTLGFNVHAAVQSYRQNYLSLDPTYADTWGRPMLRMTFDFTDNERKMLTFLTGKAQELARSMGPTHLKAAPVPEAYDITRYQTTHNVGGTAMGTDPATSVVNRHLQHHDAHNLFVLGGSVFPQNTGYNPTVTIGALADWSLKAVRERYLKDPDFLG